MLQATIPNNIAILSACLKEHDHEVKLFDTTLYRTEEISNDEKRIKRFQVKPFKIINGPLKLKDTDMFEDFVSLVNTFQPDLIGITFVDNTIEQGLQLLSKITSHIPTVAGGVSAILNPKELLSYKEIDMVCYGEGEKTIVEICNFLEGKIEKSDIKNLAYKKDNKNIFNELDEPIDINKLPFEDFTIFEEKRLMRPMSGDIHKTITINLDRGCPYSCSFCCAPFFRKKYGSKYYREKTIERIEVELDYQIKKHKPKYIYFNSETFLSMSTEKLELFAEMYEKYKLPFWCQTHVNTITDEKIKILKSMGCDKIGIGIENGNEEYRKKFLKKYFSNEQAIESFKILKKYKFDVGTNNILGFPDETRKMIFDTIKLNRKLNNILGGMSVSGFVFQPYQGTELRDYCEKCGYIDDHAKIDTLIGDPIIENPNLSNEELIGLLHTFTLYIRMNKLFYPFIRMAERSDFMLQMMGKIYWRFYDQS